MDILKEKVVNLKDKIAEVNKKYFAKYILEKCSAGDIIHISCEEVRNVCPLKNCFSFEDVVLYNNDWWMCEKIGKNTAKVQVCYESIYTLQHWANQSFNEDVLTLETSLLKARKALRQLRVDKVSEFLGSTPYENSFNLDTEWDLLECPSNTIEELCKLQNSNQKVGGINVSVNIEKIAENAFAVCAQFLSESCAANATHRCIIKVNESAVLSYIDREEDIEFFEEQDDSVYSEMLDIATIDPLYGLKNA